MENILRKNVTFRDLQGTKHLERLIELKGPVENRMFLLILKRRF
jgi:hypothetical protein